MRVIELRNYRLRAGARDAFVRYFEEHFLVSQRDVGMHVLGQFAVVGEPDRFVWIRGFEDMSARHRGLSAFYGGAFWQARRDRANAMILDHEDVYLLRPLGRVEALIGGRVLEDRAGEPPGVFPDDAGLVTVDLYRIQPGARDRVIALVPQPPPPPVGRGAQVLGHLVAELAPNDYPRLPVRQDPDLLAVLSMHPDREHYAGRRGEGAGAAGWSPVPDGDLRALLAAHASTVLLRPTARSLIRCRP